MLILNSFFNSKFFDKINPFFFRKIFKIFKCFFVQTNMKELPLINYPIQINQNEISKSEFFLYNEAKPYMTYSHLADLISFIKKENKEITFFDFGAANLNLYYYFKRKFKNVNYYFHDQKEVKKNISNIKIEKNLKDLYLDEIDSISVKIDLVYFGSSLQYVKDYKDNLKKFFDKTKYILISQTPFFSNYDLPEKIIMKQLNMHPVINYLYLFNLEQFNKFMEKNNYFLVEKNINKVTKFLNFNNFDKKIYKEINMYDLLFEYKNEKK